MKEKIKNFLLKIKKSLCTEIKTPVYKIMLFGILMIILSCICFGCSHYLNETLNEIKTEQIEETPQAESMRIEKDLKFANPTQSDFVNPSNNYNAIYFADLNYVTSGTVSNVWNLVHDYGVDLSPLGEPAFLYPFYCYDNGQSFVLGVYMAYSATNINILLGNIFVISYDGLSYTNVGYLFDYSYRVSTGEIVDTQYYQPQWWIQNLGVAQDNIDFYGQNIPIGYLNTNFSNILSTIPFESTPQQPTLENAPSSLVNTIPSNAVTTLPNNLGTKVYDSGSAWVQDPTDYNEYNAFGYQIFYKSNILTSETDMLRFTIDGITYDVEPTIYRYYLSEVYVVIYTLWDDTPIYYVSNNILDSPFPFTLDYATRFNISDLINWLSVRVDIVETYSDYLHIRFNYEYFMRLTHSDEFVWLIDEESESFDALIFSTADKPSIIKNDGFQLSIIPELDPKFSKMGQTQTNNMYSTIVHGGTINQVWSNAYHKGIVVGETTGYTDGYNDGIETGKTLQNPINPIMDFISDGASVISNVFDTKIFPGVTDDSPGITLGTMLLFPLAISLIWFVIKLFMGG